MIGGMGPGVPYSPAVALAALTATLVTLIFAFNSWWNADEKRSPKKTEPPSESSDCEVLDITSSTHKSSYHHRNITRSYSDYNDYELDSLEECSELNDSNFGDEFSSTMHDKTYKDLSNHPHDNSGLLSKSVVNEKVLTATPVQISEAVELKHVSVELTNSDIVENHSSKSGVSGETLTSCEYECVERKNRFASLDAKHSDAAVWESTTIQQSGTRLEDLGQITPQFVHFLSQLSSNHNTNDSQPEHNVTSRCEINNIGKSLHLTHECNDGFQNAECDKEFCTMKNENSEKIEENVGKDTAKFFNETIDMTGDGGDSPSAIFTNNQSCDKFLTSTADQNFELNFDETKKVKLSHVKNNDLEEIMDLENMIENKIGQDGKDIIDELHKKNYEFFDENNEIENKINENVQNNRHASFTEYEIQNSSIDENSKMELKLITPQYSDYLFEFANLSKVYENDNILDKFCAQENHSPSDSESSLLNLKSLSQLCYFLYDESEEFSERNKLQTASKYHNFSDNSLKNILKKNPFLEEKLLNKSDITPSSHFNHNVPELKHDFLSENISYIKIFKEENNQEIKRMDPLSGMHFNFPSNIGRKYFEGIQDEKSNDFRTSHTFAETRNKENSLFCSPDAKEKISEEEKEEDGEFIKRNFGNGETSTSNNGKIHSCLPSTSDVTSDAEHCGSPIREVQGSGREKLIGKECASQNYHSGITVSPAEGERNNGFPPQMAAVKDLELGMADSSCDDHDQKSNSNILNVETYQFASLDALVDHLRELGSETPPSHNASDKVKTQCNASPDENALFTNTEDGSLTSTTHSSGFISIGDSSEFLDCFSQETPKTISLNSSVDDNDINLEYLPGSVGLLSEYYSDDSSTTNDLPVSELSRSNLSSNAFNYSNLSECQYENVTNLPNDNFFPKYILSDSEINKQLSSNENVKCFSSSKSRIEIPISTNKTLDNKELTSKRNDIKTDKRNEVISDESSNSDNNMEQSPNRDRLLKLLRRNEKREERMKHLSEFTNELDGDNVHNQEQKNDTKHTLHALESAIGHIQQLIRDPTSTFLRKELKLSCPTIEADSRTEADTDVSILGKDHENTHSYHAQIKSTSLSTLDRTRTYCDDPVYKSEINSKEATNSFFPSKNAVYEKRKREEDAEFMMRSALKYPHIVKEWEMDSKIYVNNDFNSLENIEVLTADECNRWRHRHEKEAFQDHCKNIADNKRKIAQNTDAFRKIKDNINIQNNLGNWNDVRMDKSSEQSRRLKPPNHKIELMSIKDDRGHCKNNFDVTESQFLRLTEIERTAVSEKRSSSDDTLRRRIVQPFVMQEEQQNGEGSDGTAESDSPTKQNAATNTTTPTKVKNLRFKLDPDIFDLPSENGYDDYDDYDYRYRRGWKRPSKYQTFSALELGRNSNKNREPVKVVSVRTSVVPAGQKMVVKPVCVSEGQRSKPSGNNDPSVTVKHLDIDLRIRLETSEKKEKTTDSNNDVIRGDWRASPEKNIPKRQYTNISSSGHQMKKRSPVPEFSGWNQSLSPVTETCDWATTMNGSTEDLAEMSTCSDPGQRHRWTPDSSHSSPASWDSEDPPFRLKNNFPKSETLDSFAEMQNEDNNVQRTDELRHMIHSLSSDSFIYDNGSPKSDPLVSLPSSNSPPSRPSSLSLSHFRKHLNLPRKRFVPDPEAIERITGYKAAEQISSSRPPLPPGLSRPLPSYRLSSGSKNRIDQLRKRYLDSAKSQLLASQKNDGNSKFEQFLNQAQRDRDNILSSTPDLAAFEAAVRKQWTKVSMANKKHSNSENSSDSSKENTPPPVSNENSDVPYRSRSNTPDHVWMDYVQHLRRQLNRRSQSLCYLETDVDALFCMEDISQSMTTLDRSPSPESTKSVASMPITSNRKSNRVCTNLDESDRTKSEHELRIEKSLQNLQLPDWYKHSSRPKTGFLLNKKPQEKQGWSAIKSLASSTSSLSSDAKNRRSARSLRASRENLPWSRGSTSPASADNSIKGWSRSNSGPVLSLALAKAFREPYMGWRARTPSSAASPSSQVDASPPSWAVTPDIDFSDTPLTSDLQNMDHEGDTGISFDGEDVLEENSTSNKLKDFLKHCDSPVMEVPSADDTCDDVINISLDTCEDQNSVPLRNGHGDKTNSSRNYGGEDTCDDIKNITLDTLDDQICDKVLSPQTGDDTCDDVLNISTDTTSPHVVLPLVNGDVERVVSNHRHIHEDIQKIDTKGVNGLSHLSKPLTNGSNHHSELESPVILKSREKDTNKSKFDPKRKRYSYNRSIYQNELDGLRVGEHDSKMQVDMRCSTRSLPSKNREICDDDRDSNKVIWIESSFVGSRTTTSIVVLPTDSHEKIDSRKTGSTGSNSSVGRPASR